jgi:hypothetical protein
LRGCTSLHAMRLHVFTKKNQGDKVNLANEAPHNGALYLLRFIKVIGLCRHFLFKVLDFCFQALYFLCLLPGVHHEVVYARVFCLLGFFFNKFFLLLKKKTTTFFF